MPASLDAPAAPTAPAQGRFVLLRAGTLRLLLPQADVARIGHAGGDRRRLAVSERLQLLPEVPAGRFIETVLGHDGDACWCWDEVRIVAGLPGEPVPLPPALLDDRSPLRAYVDVDDTIAFLCDARGLRAHLREART